MLGRLNLPLFAGRGLGAHRTDLDLVALSICDGRGLRRLGLRLLLHGFLLYGARLFRGFRLFRRFRRSEEHTSELQSLMRISYAVFCLKKKTNTHPNSIMK